MLKNKTKDRNIKIFGCKYLLLILIIVSLCSCGKETKIDFLTDVALKYYEEEMKDEETRNFYKNIDLKNFVLEITQEEDFKGFEIYTVIFTSSIKKEPDFLKNKKGNIYIPIYLRDSKVEKKEIPHFLKYNHDLFWDESSLLIVYCKNTKNYLLLKLIEGYSIETIENINNFNCNKKNNQNMEIENAIINYQEIPIEE